MDDKQSSESISQLIKYVDNGNIVLPEFQRDFVWDIGKTYDLFDSLIRDIFIGSLIYGIPSFEVTVREIDKRPRKIKGKKRSKLITYDYSMEQIESKVKTGTFRLLLDGQQRITALYRALHDIDSVWLIVKNDDELDDDLIDKEFYELSLENIVHTLRSNEDESRLSINIANAFSLLKGEIIFEREIKSLYFDKLKFVQGLPLEDQELLFRKYLIIIKKVQAMLTGEKLINYYLLNMTSEKFALFFERSNSTGIQLNFIDILAAKLYRGFNLRKAIEEFETIHGDKYTFNREIIVRTISYIVSEGKNVDKGYILNNLTYHNFDILWEELCNLYLQVLDFLYKNHFIISQSWMPYENMLIPLIIFLRELPHKEFSQMNEKQKEFIHFWYWSAIFAQRYSSSTNDVILEDTDILTKIARSKKITDKSYFHKIKVNISPDEIFSFSKKGSSIYQGILNIINYNSKGLKDWNNTDPIAFNSKIDDHHIFPQGYLKGLGDVDEYADLIDCVANRTLIPKITNITIGKKSPSEYLKLIMTNNPKLQESLNSHLINPDLITGLYDEFYPDFLEERSNNIYQVIKSTVIDRYDTINSEHYEQSKLKYATTIKVFATYKGNQVDATFNVDTQDILYKGGKYSVSNAADLAKFDLTGKTNTSTNGWTFWKYYDENRNSRPINDFR